MSKSSSLNDILFAASVGVLAGAAACASSTMDPTTPQIRRTIEMKTLLRDAYLNMTESYFSLGRTILVKPEWIEINGLMCMRIRTYRNSSHGVQLGERIYAKLPARLCFDDRGYMFPC